MAYGFDIGVVIKATLRTLLQVKTPLIFYTNSKSLYDCLVKLGTIQEKRLLIDVMNFHQLYKRREVTKIKWIHGHNNLADLMTKTKPFSALKTVLNTNCINLDTIKWVEREVGTKKKKEVKRNKGNEVIDEEMSFLKRFQ